MPNGQPEVYSLRQLRGRIDAWIQGKLWLQVIVGLVAGFLLGFLLGPDLGWVSPKTADIIGRWIALPGRLFLSLISMVLIPLVLISIVQGLTQSKSGHELRVLGTKLTVFVVVTTTIAAAIGVLLALTFQPGSYIDDAVAISMESPARPEPATPEDAEFRAPDMIANLIPTNPLAAMVERDMLAVVIFAILLGIACSNVKRERIEIFLRCLSGVLDVSMTIVKWAMFLVPWAVFGLMAQLVSKVGISTLAGMAVYVGTVLLGLLLLLILYLLLVSILGRRNPFSFLSNIGSVQLLAFSTSSTTAVIPLSIETAVKKLNVKESVANVVIPLAATVNMAGTALYQSVAIIFLAQMSGVKLDPGDLAIIVMTLVASSIGAPGTPGVGIVILENVALGFGIPTIGLVLILGIDRILDMSRTAVNVTGDLTACVLFGSHKEDRRTDSSPQ